MSNSGETRLGDLSTPQSFFETMNAERECYKTFMDYFHFIDTKMPCEHAGDCFTENVEIAYHMKGTPMIFHGRSDYVSFLKPATAAQEMIDPRRDRSR